MGQFCSICGSREEPHQATAFADTSSSSDIPDYHYTQPSPALSNSQQQAAAGANAPEYSNSGHGSIPHLDPGSKGRDQQLDNTTIEENDNERQLAQYRLEQAELARREAIVTTASQSMVPVGSSSSGSTAMMGMHHHRMMGYHHHNQQHHHMGGIMNSYYDPAYAAAAAQAILRSAAHTGGLVFSNDMATHAAMNVSIMGTLPKPSMTQSLTNSKDVIDMLGKGMWDGVKLGSRGRLAGCGGEDPEYYLDDLAEAILEKMVPTKTALFGGCPPIVENLP